ncbi:MAG: HRDC domain-containing protein [Pirellulaceae bacterium]
MAFRFFTIPIQNNESATEELNAFLRSHKTLSVDRRWVDLGPSSFWSICVDYLDAAAVSGGSRQQRPRGKVDYREILSPENFAVFAKLRDLRRDIAQSEAVPVYTIFTNEQLAQMVQTRATSRAALEKIAGVGDARIEKYGRKFLELLLQQWNERSHETGGQSL